MKIVTKKLIEMKLPLFIDTFDRKFNPYGMFARFNVSNQLPLTKLYFILLVLIFSFFSCKKKDNLPQIPTITTNELIPTAANSATGGGNIISAGDAQITKAGLCYSSTNQMPTISDDTTVISVSIGSFESVINNLNSSSTYYVRAYAINSFGIGYGAVKSIVTGNAAPEAFNVTIEGTVRVNDTLTASYVYSDAEGDIENNSLIQWYIASNASGTEEIPISGATSLKYKLKPDDEFKFIRVGITPKTSTGTTSGIEVKSLFTEAVKDAVSVTFTYNGVEVTYGIITSAITGRQWMDRNLGATREASSASDYLARGDLFQWGRGTDGHQLINWDEATGTPINGMTSTLSLSDNAGHNLYILSSSDPYDWSTPQNSSRWQEPDYINNPCPLGWQIPTTQEWNSEQLETNLSTNELKLVAAGFRRPDNGKVSALGIGQGTYWTSTVANPALSFKSYDAYRFYVTEGIPDYWEWINGNFPGYGNSCRCIKKL
jgi:hypothetical protein